MERFSQHINKQSAEHHIGYDSCLNTHTHIIIIIISFYSGCYNKILEIRWLKQQKFISHSLRSEPGGQRSKCRPIQALVRAPDGALLITSSQREEALAFSSLCYKDTRGTFMSSGKSHYLPKAPRSSTIPQWGKRAVLGLQCMHFRGTEPFSP